jgi:RNA polymerase sigma-19 factor, ECF subfamily
MRSISDDQFRSWGQGLRNSDSRSYSDLFDATYDGLMRYAVYIVREQNSASDIIQDVFMKLWQIRAEIDPDRSLRALLYQMVRNYALNHERQKKRHATEELETDHPSVGFEMMTDERLDAESLGQKISEWIDNMPERRREAFMLSRYEGLSHDEIAALMNLAPKTVNNHIVLALQHIRKLMQAFEEKSSSRK